jgi:hypothetical protein
MIRVPCVVRFEDGETFIDVPSIRPFVDSGFTVVDLTPFDDWYNREGRTIHYRVVFNPESNVPKSVEVVSWENVHDSEWSEELHRVNESYV